MQKHGNAHLEIVADSYGPSKQRLTTFVAVVSRDTALAFDRFPGIASSRCESIFEEAGQVWFTQHNLNDAYARIVFTVDGNGMLNTMKTMCPKLYDLHAVVDGASNMMLANHANVQKLNPGGWHLPFVGLDDFEIYCRAYDKALEWGHMTMTVALEAAMHKLRVLSLTRIARGGKDYWPGTQAEFTFTPDNTAQLNAEIVKRFDLYSPMMCHIAYTDAAENGRWDTPYLHENFPGWVGYRRLYMLETIEYENQRNQESESNAGT